jgi:hypothetical protein
MLTLVDAEAFAGRRIIVLRKWHADEADSICTEKYAQIIPNSVETDRVIEVVSVSRREL